MQERALRDALEPFLAAARPAHTAPTGAATTVSDHLRAARIRALLGISSGADSAGLEPGLQQLLNHAAEVYGRSLTEQTRATYRRRWRRFEGWCAAEGLRSAPAEPATVMLFLSSLTLQPHPASLGTVRGFVHAINRVHTELALPLPGDDPTMHLLMRGLSRSIPASRATPAVDALRIEELRLVCRHLDLPDPRVVRDRAIVALAHAGLSNGVIARLRWPEVKLSRRKVILGERLAKNARVSSWRILPASKGPGCPVAGLLAWRDLAGTVPTAVFSSVDRTGARRSRPLSPSAVNEVLRSRADSLGGVTDAIDFLRLAALLSMPAAEQLRDRALLLLGFAMAARRGEITRLVWEDLRVVEDGLLVRLRWSKTDLDGRGTDLGVPYGRSLITCPVRAVLAWRTRVEQQLGEQFTPATRVFVAVGRGGRISPDRPLSNEALTMVVRRRMQDAGLQGRWGGRSLRAGLISTAADLELPLELIAQQSRHASLDALVRYIRHEDLFRRNAADRVGL
jgi:integrase